MTQEVRSCGRNNTLPEGSDDRVIIRINIRSAFKPFFTPGMALRESDRTKLHPRLAGKGLKEEQWKKYAERLEKEVQPYTITNCKEFFFWLLFLPCLCLPTLWIIIRSFFHDRKLRKWLQDINEELFLPRGMMAKVQTVYMSIRGNLQITSWLAIAMNPSESDKLKREPVCWKGSNDPDFIESGCCCWQSRCLCMCPREI
jgi:hypothetical protein